MLDLDVVSLLEIDVSHLYRSPFPCLTEQITISLKYRTSEQEFKTLARCFFFPTHADFVFSVIVIVIEYFSIIIPTSLSDFNRCENILFHWEYRRERWRGEEAIDEKEVKI